ncbi:hypothetical protein QCA50_010267 [Cerrena zonata]|uniref:Homeobox domain-containing protein n=1 Tax=Cerrena zonata TaxID=2478898 RepID=A0AAW0G9U5_9APHY
MVLPQDDWSQSPPPDEKVDELARDQKDKPKKPRHRHSAFQLAALNELYEQNDHPPLQSRTSLAERLGMEVKTVNAWFQNKRASTKKRSTKASASQPSVQPSQQSYELPPISALIASVPSPAPQSVHQDFDELSEDDHLSHFSDRDLSRIPYSSSEHHRQRQTSFFAGNAQHRHAIESDQSMPRKGRSRPTQVQTEQLKAFYEHTSHPTKIQREELGQRIGMRYQSVTNWFQNQRSIAKKRKDDEDAQSGVVRSTDFDQSSSSSRTYSPFPPSSSTIHPSLAANVPPATNHPSLPSSLVGIIPRARRAASAAPGSSIGYDSRASSPRVSPYRLPVGERASSVSNNRSRRTRPDPYQLEALKKLFRRTPTPSIEERGALALEINMDVGKVTNWFRNIRQTARRRSQRNPDDMDDMDFDDISVGGHTIYSRDVSRAGSPFPSMSPSSDSPISQEQDDGDIVMQDVETRRYPEPMELTVKLEIEDKHHKMYSSAPISRSHSDMGSEEDYQEAVTPPSEASPLPPFARAARTHRAERKREIVHKHHHPHHPPAPPTRDLTLSVDTITYAEMEKATAKFQTGVRVEDALLLLSFHHNVVR